MASNDKNHEQQKTDVDYAGSHSSPTTTSSSSSVPLPAAAAAPPPPAPSRSQAAVPPPSPCVTNNPSLIGRSVADASDWINDNLIAVRYGVMATIGLLTMYGVSQTPLFFRFSNVKDIPNSYFVKQKSLSCRLIRIQQKHQQAAQQRQSLAGKRQQETSITSNSQQQQQQPIRMWVRHLSPAESWLFMSVVPSSWFDWYMKMHPQATGGANRRPDENKSELLLVQVAGIIATTPASQPYGLRTGTEWIQKNLLEKQQQTLVTCQLLERQRLADSFGSNGSGDDGEEEDEAEPVDMAAVKVYFRPASNTWQFFSTDLAQYMVRNGLANPAVAVNNQMMSRKKTTTSDISSSRTLMDNKQEQQLRRRRQAESSYMKDLQRAEMEAAKESRGMWSDPVVRQERRDIMDEVEFQTSATTGQKVWRWIKQAWQRRRKKRPRVVRSNNNNHYTRSDDRD